MKTGDKITVLMPGNDVLHTSFEIPSTLFSKLQFHTHATCVEMLRYDEEGVTWLRGHHLCDSKEVAGCRVAIALGTPEKAPTSSAPSHAHAPLIAHAVGQIAGMLIEKFITGDKKP